VLFLDEPTSALDPAGRHDILELIASLRGRVTVFLSSHILSDIERVCDTVCIIHEGQLVLVADRDELLARYATNVMALEIDRDGLALLDAFVTRLQAQPWVTGVTRQDNVVRITVNDVTRSKLALWPLVAEHSLPLVRYEWVRPSLEDIFLTISVSGDEASKV
jgi:ABC-2 type transport system ATP-binding protein